MSAASEEWQVARRRKGKNGKSKVHLRSLNSQEHLDVDKTVKRLRETVSDLRCESFFEKWKDELLIAASDLRHQILENKNEESRVSADHSGKCSSPGQMQCVCYGLGPFSCCVSARYQLAMLLLLLEAAQIELSDCFIYDPIFTTGEKAVLKELGLTVLIKNEEGKRRANEPTLFYLLHCGKALYNNLLWKNWDKHYLTQMIIIGNCFSAMKDRAIDREFSRDYNYISRITSVCKEIVLPCPSHMIDVFSDSAVLTFPSSDVYKLSQSTWINQPEPQYEHCVDLEIVQKSKDTSSFV